MITYDDLRSIIEELLDNRTIQLYIKGEWRDLSKYELSKFSEEGLYYSAWRVKSEVQD